MGLNRGGFQGSRLFGSAGSAADRTDSTTLVVLQLRMVGDDLTLPGNLAMHGYRPAGFLEVPCALLVESLRTVNRTLYLRFAAYHQQA